MRWQDKAAEFIKARKELNALMAEQTDINAQIRELTWRQQKGALAISKAKGHFEALRDIVATLAANEVEEKPHVG